MRPAAAILVLASACTLGACGTSDHDAVQAKVHQFLQATAGKDFKTLCGQVLAPSLVRRLAASGVGCEQAMRIALTGLRDPTLSIGRISVTGERASVITLTGAAGQQSSLDAIGLVRTGQGWRVASLGSPLGTAGAGGTQGG